MTTGNKNIKLAKTAKWLLAILTIIMILRITSYFTVAPSSVAITRVLKTGTRLLLTGGVLVLLWMLQSRRQHLKFHTRALIPISLYLMYLFMGVLSIFWTTHLSFTLLQLAMTIESIIFVYLFHKLLCLYDVAYEKDFPTFIHITNTSTFIISIVFIAGIFAAPETFYRETHGGAVSRLGGYIINPNELGMLAVLSAVMVYIELLNDRRKFFNTLSLVVAIATLLLTQSRSSLGSFLLVTGIFILLSKNYWIKVGSVVGAILAFPIVVQTIILKQGDLNEVMSMTGRIPFWDDLINIGFPQSPLIGFGFMSISPSIYSDKFNSIHSYAASMTHNTFIQVLINLGLIGAFIVAFQMIFTFHSLAIFKNKQLRLLIACMLIPLIINSTTEFGIFGESNYAIMFYQMIIMFLTIEVIDRRKENNDHLNNYFPTSSLLIESKEGS